LTLFELISLLGLTFENEDLVPRSGYF